MTVKTQQFYYNVLIQGYMFRLLRVIIRPSNELTQDYLSPSALRNPGALTMVGVIVVLSTCPPYNYSTQLPMVSML